MEPSRRFRWVGQVSEEELLGIPVAASRHRARPVTRSSGLRRSSRLPAPPAAPRRRVQARGVLVALGAAASVWLLVAGGGSSFRSSAWAPPEPTEAGVSVLLNLDERSVGTRPPGDLRSPSSRKDAAEAKPRAPKPPEGRNQTPPSQSPPGGGTEPLLEASVPLVGTVTVEEPRLPVIDTLPELPPADELLPEPSSLPLP